MARSSWIVEQPSAIHGRGLYASKAIPAGTRVIEYTGEKITKAESKRREKLRLARLRRGQDDCVYIFTINDRYDLDGSPKSNIAGQMNHSCAPNCHSEIIRGKVWIIANRDIPAGEELTFDYGFPFAEWRLHPCCCGAARCPGFIVEAQQRWRLRRQGRL